MQAASRKKDLINEIKKVISLPDKLTFKDEDGQNLMNSCQIQSIKLQIKKINDVDMRYLTRKVLDQSWSELCVPISITELIRHAMKHDLSFVDTKNEYSTEEILTTLTMEVFPRSMAGLNRNPKRNETSFQKCDVETLLERLTKKTFLNESGWDIVRDQGFYKPRRSICEFYKGYHSSKVQFSKLFLF